MSDPTMYPANPQANRYGPITAGQMFERTAALLRENPKLFFGIVLVMFAVDVVVGAVLGGTGIWMGLGERSASPLAKMLFVLPLSLLGGLLVFVFAQIVRGALFVAAQARLADAPMTVGDAWKLATEKGGRLIGISILVFLRMAGYLILLYMALAVPFLGIAIFSGALHASGGSFGHGMGLAMLGLVAIFLLAGLVLYLAAMLWLVTRYALSIPAAMAENVSITHSIRRSIDLSRGSKGRLIALYVGVACAYMVLAAFVIPVQLMMAHSMMAHGGQLTTGVRGVTLVVELWWNIWGAIAIAFIGVATTLCYYDLRVRKEGFGGTATAPAIAAPPMPPTPASDWPVEDLPVS